MYHFLQYKVVDINRPLAIFNVFMLYLIKIHVNLSTVNKFENKQSNNQLLMKIVGLTPLSPKTKSLVHSVLKQHVAFAKTLRP